MSGTVPDSGVIKLTEESLSVYLTDLSFLEKTSMLQKHTLTR